MTGARRGWAVFAAVLPLTVVNLMHLVRQRADLVGAWPVWRPVLLEVTLLIAGATVVAGVAFGLHAWREAERGRHA